MAEAWPAKSGGGGGGGGWQLRGQPRKQPAGPVVAPSRVLPSGTGGINQYHYPFARQENQLENIAIAQDSTRLNTLNLGYSAHGKLGLDNSFLALLSGPSRHLRSGHSQLPNTRCGVPVNDPPVCDSGNVATNGSSIVPLPRAAAMAMADLGGHLTGTELDGSFFASRQQSQSMYNQSLVLHDSLHTAPSFHYSSNSCKSGGPQALHGSGTAVGVPSLINGRNTEHFKASTSPCPYTKTQFTPKTVSEVKSIDSDHNSAYKTGTLRVFCMGTVGELFLNEKGLLGVICSCHSLCMSVAKFSEHSGSLLSNPGEAVRLESGQTIAQWRRIFYLQAGVRVMDDNGGWDWADCTSLRSGLVGSKPNSTEEAIFSESSQSLKFLSVFGGPERCSNSFSYFQQSNIGHSVSEGLCVGTPHDAPQKNALNNQNPSLKAPNGSLHDSLLWPSNSQMMPGMKEDHGYGDLWMTKCAPVPGKGKHNVGCQFRAHHVDSIDKGYGNQLSLLNCSISGDILPGRVPSASSDFELSLGQPSYQGGTFFGGSAYVGGHRSVQMFNSNKQLCELIPPQSSVPSVTEETQQYLWDAPPERLISGRNMLQHGSTGAINSSESREFDDELNKGSSLSLFLSHLNTFGGNTSSQVTDNILNSYESPVPKSLNADSYAEHFTSNVLKRITSEAESNLEMSKTDSSYPVNKGKGQGIIVSHADGRISCPSPKPDSFQQMNKAEPGRLSEVTNEHSLFSSSAVIGCRASNYVDNNAELPVKETDARNPNKSGKTFYTKNYDDQEHTLLSFMESLPSSSGRTSFVPASNPTSLNSVYISNRMPPLSTKRSLDASHCLLDENIKFIALKHMAELSQQKCANSSLDMSPHHGIQYCPLASELQSKNSQEVSTSLEEQRQCYCCFKQDTSQATAKTLLRCPNCHSTNAIHMSAGKIGTAVLDTSCCHASSATRMPLCSGGHNIQCKLCCDEPLLLSLGRIENNCIDPVQREMSNLKVQNSTYGLCRCHNIHNDKEHRNNSYGRCGCHTLPRCLSGCCHSQEGSHSNAFREYKICGSTEMLRSPLLNIECMKQDASASNGCGGLKKQVVMNNDLYSTAWTDVPGNLVGNSNISPIEKPGQNLQATDIVEGQATNTAFKESDGDFMEAEAEEEDQMSNICSGCSGPSITEISADCNVTASCDVGIGNGKLIHDFVDEESGIERCGSSGVTLDGRKWDKPLKANAKVLLRKSCGIPCQPSIDPTNTLNFRCSSKFKKIRSHRRASKTGKTEKKKMLTAKWKKLDASNVDSVYSPVNHDLPNCSDQPEQQFPSFEGKESSLHLGDETQNVSIYASKASGFKRKRTSPSYGKIYSGKRSINHNEVLENGYLQLAVDCYQNDFPSKNIKEVSSEDENASSTKWDDSHEIAIKHPKYISLSDTIKFSFRGAEHCKKKLRPVVCGDSGIIANGDLSSQSRPPKFVSLRTILKNTRNGTTLETKHDCCQTSKLVAKKASIGTNSGSCDNLFMMEKKDEDKDLDNKVISSSRTDKGFFSARRSVGISLLLGTEGNNGSIKASKSGVHFGLSNPKIKKRSKEIRKRSLDELIGNVKGPCCTGSAIAGKSQKILNCKLSKTSRRVVNSQMSQDCTSSPSQINAGNLSCKGRKCPLTFSNSDAFCCVCGSSNKDDINRLIECNQCFIKVHQACYGILKVPKGHWCCRPCRTNSRNIVCVLCGYDGGAMTRAVRSRTIVRSLLKAWKVEKISKPLKSVPSENLKDDLDISTNLIDEPLEHISNSIARPVNVELSSNTSQKLDPLSFSSATRQLNELSSFYGVQNSITAGMLDSSVTQWVHMVCGLWTPGTRCPNVNTMSAFDVSGAVTSRKNTVCSLCNRPGGSCIQCRVVNCTAYFHPWCAHQKGLLQSEIEGVDDENVGFYGRCSLHASHECYHADSHSMEAEAESPRKKEFSCARIEGYKGRKKGKGFICNLQKKSDESSGYIVPQEQVNAWFHINGQKLCAKGIVKQPVASDTESDCRREYTRYKQAKGWKQLVVYKSGIHALGLYTSLFIARGAMVVEYVGEIVGLRVADKREIEYQSGRKLQYKSACYFFRIDKDHIIDATEKGGIARFVNHSCLPNCVAKVISVRNEKKVVFFAERDINPGEEITYDYNFNHEDEGKKIPCFCNSKNCRRYLN